MTWATVALGEVCEVVSGATPKTSNPDYWDGEIAWVTPKDLSDLQGKYLDDTPRKITGVGFANCSAKMLPENSVLFSSRAPIGLVAINRVPVCTNQGFKSLVPQKDRLSSEYLYWWLRSNTSKLQSLGRGATFKEVSKSIVEGISIPLPPLPEQERIAAILGAADALRAKRRESLELLDELVQSVFLDVFGDPVTNPKGWEVGVMGDLLESTSYGTSAKASTDPKEFPVLRMGNISYSGEWDFSDLKYVDLSEKEKHKYLIHSGHILFNRTNSKELVGKTAVYRQKERMAFAGYLIRAVAGPNAEPEFIGAFMNLPQTKQYLQNLCRNIVGMANINATEFRSIPIIMPPLAEQRRFTDVVHGILAQKCRVRCHLTELDTLFASLQSRAFRGEL